jgi:hypothetical protein
MSQKLNVILAARMHLPSGTSEAVFEALYNNEIKPLISALDKFPKINVMFYYSGVILYWIERHHPELFMLIEDLLSRKQAEFLGGGFYDPVFPLLPLTDKIGQMEMLTTYLRKHFGKRPLGCWLPAMAWEQNLVGTLNSCGMNYTFLEEEQFSGSGMMRDTGGVFTPCVTEDQGKLIMVFPVAFTLGRKLRQEEPLKVLDELLEKLPPNWNDQVVVFPIQGDPQFEGESISQTEKQEPEYEKLFEQLSNAESRVKFTCPARIYKNLRYLKKTYFQSLWVPGNSHPRQFLANHPEAGGIYAKMIYVHTLINNQLRGDKTRKRTALEELWKAEDSGLCRFGTASFPGLLHSPVRKAAYRSLLEAEKISREKRKFTPSLSFFDFNLDGESEFIFQDEKINCHVKSLGASILELDYLPSAWNYLDTLLPDIVNLNENEKRCSFVDWLAPADTNFTDAGLKGIMGGRCCGSDEYEVSETDRDQRRVTFRLPPKTDRLYGEIEIGKAWQLKKNSIAVEYVLKNTGNKKQAFTFIPSIDLSFPGEDEGFLRIFSIQEGGKESIALDKVPTAKNAKALEFQDIKNEALITLELNRSFDAQIFHVRSGFPDSEEYQSTCIMPFLPVSLEAGKTWKAAFSLKISS